MPYMKESKKAQVSTVRVTTSRIASKASRLPWTDALCARDISFTDTSISIFSLYLVYTSCCGCVVESYNEQKSKQVGYD